MKMVRFVIGFPLNSMLLLLNCPRRKSKNVMVVVVINVNKFMLIQSIYMNSCLKSEEFLNVLRKMTVIVIY